MLYVFYGERNQARDHTAKFIEVCREKRKKAEYIHIGVHLEQSFSLEELLHSQGLFEKKYIVFCDEILSEKDMVEYFNKHLKQYNESLHLFVVFEPDLTKQEESQFKKSGAVLKKFTNKQKTNTSVNHLFAFAETVMKKNKQASLTDLHTLLKKKEDPVSILNILLWQIRTAGIVAYSKNEQETGLKPFVYSKTKKMVDSGQIPVREMMLCAENIVRNGRLNGLSEEEIIERVILKT